MAVLFRPLIPVDNLHWVPLLKETLKPFDMRIWPEQGDPAEITYMVAWKVFPGDANAWPNLKAILSLSAGVNQYIGHPDFPKGAQLIRMIEPGLSQGMMEYVVSYVLRFHKQHDQMRALAKAPWGSVIPKLSRECRVGIMGMGEMGTACARALGALGFVVNGWSRTAKTLPHVKSFAGAEQLDEFLQQTDILVCLLPLTSETRDILNRDTLSRLPRGACVINAARGKHLVEEDLLELLNSNHIAQAALDVFREEPLPQNHPFWAHPRIHITPHLSAITMPFTAAQSLKQSIQQIERGERPAGWVDMAKGY
ncbi:MAG: 2-hydroxyacid dehydrogenase [Micavibrio sp.]